jgi:hypothetical protein
MTDLPTPKYKIDDTVFCASRLRQCKKVQCPDCLGHKTWSVTAPSGETWETVCGTCERGYMGSLGVIDRWEVDDYIQQLTIGSVQIDTANTPEETVRYMCLETGVGSGSVYYEPHLHPTIEAAKAWCLGEANRYADEENKRLAKIAAHRKKDTRTKPTYEQKHIKILERRIAELTKP